MPQGASRKVKDIQWITLFEQKVALLTLEDSQVVCFDQDGQQVKLLSDAIFSQNIIGNFGHFTQRSGLQVKEN